MSLVAIARVDLQTRDPPRPRKGKLQHHLYPGGCALEVGWLRRCWPAHAAAWFENAELAKVGFLHVGARRSAGRNNCWRGAPGNGHSLDVRAV